MAKTRRHRQNRKSTRRMRGGVSWLFGPSKNNIKRKEDYKGLLDILKPQIEKLQRKINSNGYLGNANSNEYATLKTRYEGYLEEFKKVAKKEEYANYEKVLE